MHPHQIFFAFITGKNAQSPPQMLPMICGSYDRKGVRVKTMRNIRPTHRACDAYNVMRQWEKATAATSEAAKNILIPNPGKGKLQFQYQSTRGAERWVGADSPAGRH